MGYNTLEQIVERVNAAKQALEAGALRAWVERHYGPEAAYAEGETEDLYNDEGGSDTWIGAVYVYDAEGNQMELPEAAPELFVRDKTAAWEGGKLSDWQKGIATTAEEYVEQCWEGLEDWLYDDINGYLSSDLGEAGRIVLANAPDLTSED